VTRAEIIAAIQSCDAPEAAKRDAIAWMETLTENHVYLLTEFAKSQQHEALHEAKQRCYRHGKALPDGDRRRGAWDCIEVISDQIREIGKQ